MMIALTWFNCIEINVINHGYGLWFQESISVCEQQLAQCEAAQTEQSLLSEERQHQTQRHQSQALQFIYFIYAM